MTTIKFKPLNFIPVILLLTMVMLGFINWWVFIAIIVGNMKFQK